MRLVGDYKCRVDWVVVHQARSNDISQTYSQVWCEKTHPFGLFLLPSYTSPHFHEGTLIRNPLPRGLSWCVCVLGYNTIFGVICLNIHPAPYLHILNVIDWKKGRQFLW